MNTLRTLIFLLGSMVGVGAALSAQPAMTQGSRVLEDTNALIGVHSKEGRIWTYLGCAIEDVEKKRLAVGTFLPTTPHRFNVLTCTLVLEYVTESGRMFRVPAEELHFGRSSEAVVPTEEAASAVRLFTREGELLGEWVEAREHWRVQPEPEDRIEAWPLCWIDEGTLGFRAELNPKHAFRTPKPEEHRWGRYSYLRWSWDGGATWGELRYPSDKENWAWTLPQDNLRQHPEAKVELIISRGSHIQRKSFAVADLPKCLKGQGKG